jgi:hypothetical protein
MAWGSGDIPVDSEAVWITIRYLEVMMIVN